jgi:hypothetical protein
VRGDQVSNDDTQTRATTISAFIAELIETHQKKCDDEQPGYDVVVPHVVSELFGTEADIVKITNHDDTLWLELNDGSSFKITVQQRS